jgi:hypothetical protein
MSNILRRPMFRGGRVESRGTGITSGLGYAKGGQVTPKRGLVNGPGGYAGIPQTPTGGQLLQQAGAFSPQNIEQYRTQQRISSTPTLTINEMDQKYRDYIKKLEEETSPLPEGDILSPDDLMMYGDQQQRLGEELGFFSSEAGEKAFKSPLLKQRDNLNIQRKKVGLQPLEQLGSSGVTTDIEVEPSGLLDSEGNLTKKGKDQTKQVIVSNSGDGDASTVDENDLENMISRYEELLGSKKARQRDAGDMLARASAAFLKPPARGEKRGITEALGDFMTAEAASGPSRTEKISQAAGMLGIKGEQAKDLYSLKQAADKKYSPSITQKKIQYIRSLPKDSPEYVLALRTEKLSSTLASESKTRSMAGDTMSAAEVNSYGPIYYDDWKGQFIPGQSKQDGTYLNIKEKKIITFKNGELVSTVDIKI